MTGSGDIVVGIDGSEHADRALVWAAEQALLEKRSLTLVAAGEDASTVSERALASTRNDYPTVPVHALRRSRDPRAILLDLSRDAHLVVVGSRGRGTLRSMLLGSVSAAVSAHAECPVVVCRPIVGDHPTHGVVVGADGTRESLPVVEFAYRQAALRELPLTVLHSFWDAAVAVAQYRESAGLGVEEPDLEDLRSVLATSVAGLAEIYPDVQVTFELKHGFADEALSPRGKRWDLIVVGRHPKTSVDRLLTGSISRSVLERASSTVAVVPEAAPAS
jgi:nucleotide-binding universal stress UspA family protein